MTITAYAKLYTHASGLQPILGGVTFEGGVAVDIDDLVSAGSSFVIVPDGTQRLRIKTVGLAANKATIYYGGDETDGVPYPLTGTTGTDVNDIPGTDTGFDCNADDGTNVLHFALAAAPGVSVIEVWAYGEVR